jgi:hypothetical protein
MAEVDSNPVVLTENSIQTEFEHWQEPVASRYSIPYGQNIGHIISRVPQNSDKPEKTGFLKFSAGARRLRIHWAAMPAGFVNRLRRGVQFDDCENTNRGCMGHRYTMGSDAGLYYRLG